MEPHSVAQYAKKVLELVTKLSHEQTEQINGVVTEYFVEFESIQQERSQINEDINKFFIQRGQVVIGENIRVIYLETRFPRSR